MIIHTHTQTHIDRQTDRGWGEREKTMLFLSKNLLQIMDFNIIYGEQKLAGKAIVQW